MLFVMYSNDHPVGMLCTPCKYSMVIITNYAHPVVILYTMCHPLQTTAVCVLWNTYSNNYYNWHERAAFQSVGVRVADWQRH